MIWPVLAFLLALVGCARPDGPPTQLSSPPPRADIRRGEAPRVLDQASRLRDEAAEYVRTNDDAKASDLIRAIELTRTMQRAVRRMRAHPTARNIAAAKLAISALRAAIRVPSDAGGGASDHR